MVRYVYDFASGGRALAALLGGKGANLAEMTRLGLPVPPGFTVTTEACRAFLATGAEPDTLAAEISERLIALEEAAGRRLGQSDDPLLLSVRSGARFSMPGMMETILDVGLGDDSVHGLAKVSGNDRFAWDSYRRLIQMFGSTVMGVDGSLFENAMADLKRSRGATNDLGLNAADLAGLVGTYKELIRRATGEDFPQALSEQLRRAVLAVFRAAAGEKVALVRQETTPDDLPGMIAAQAVLTSRGGKTSHAAVVALPWTGTCDSR